MRIFFFLLIVLATPKLNGQTLERWLISAGGHIRTSPNIHLSGTAGEPIIGFTQNSNYILSVGFQQGNTGMVGIHEQNDDYSLNVFPVPASHSIRIELYFLEPKKVNYTFFDITGSKKLLYGEAGEDIHIKKDIDISHLPSGNYLLLLTLSNSETKSIKIQKIN